MSVFAQFSDRVRQFRQNQVAISQLRSMSNRELEDIGVTRGNIEAAVRGQI